MQSITTSPNPKPRTPPPAGPLSSPLFLRVHLAMTAVLILGFVVVGVMAATGNLRFGKAAATEDAVKAEDDKEKDAEKEKPKATEGRYQIEASDDARAAVGLGMGGLGVPVREAWVFRYRGGYVQCKLESDSGKAVEKPEVPRDWTGLIDDPEKPNKEGYVVLISMGRTVEEDLAALHPHMGAVFTPGPAGPLHSLVPYYHEIWRRCQYRLFLTARPPTGLAGRGFTAESKHSLLIRSPFTNDDPNPDTEQTHVSGGKDLEAGKEITILERRRALSTVRLKARFLTDEEVIEKAKADGNEKGDPEK